MAAHLILNTDSTYVPMDTFCWLVKFTEVTGHNNTKLISDKYKGIRWATQYTSDGIIKNNPVIINLSLHSSDRFNFMCVIQGAVWDKHNKKIAEIPSNCRIFKNRSEKLEIILENPGKYVINNELKLELYVWVTFDIALSHKCLKADSLMKDLDRLLGERSKSGDVTLIAGESTWKVHKTIAAARSPVLGATLNEEGDEYHFQDVDKEVITNLVTYLYTDQVPGIEKYAKELYPVACQLKMPSLKEPCEKEIEKSLTVDNACEILIYVDKFPGPLRAKVIEFMKDNFTDVKVTSGFKSMISTHSHLSMEVCFLILDVDAKPDGHTAG